MTWCKECRERVEVPAQDERGERYPLHQTCFDAWRESRARDILEWRPRWQKDVRAYGLDALRQFPDWPFARVAHEDFPKCCKRPRLRGIANRYSFEMGNIVLIGPPGIGKTVTCVATAHRLYAEAVQRVIDADKVSQFFTCKDQGLERIARMRLVSAHQLAKARRESPLGKEEADLVCKAMTCPLLIIDELGFEMKNDEVIFEILDERYKVQRITWVTSGSTSNDIKARYGSGFWRRLTEHGVLVEET